jgi:hypothetical protein
MPKLSNMQGATGTIEIAVPGDDPLVVVYRRNAVTPRLQQKLAHIQEHVRAHGADTTPEPEWLTVLCQLYASVIASWNLTDEHGVEIACDADSLADVDFGTLNLVMQEVGRQSQPDPLSGGASSNGSSRTAGSELRQITTAS